MSDKSPTVYHAVSGSFGAYGLGKTQAREAVRLGVKMHNNRTGQDVPVPNNEEIDLTELEFGKPMKDGRYL